MRLNAALALRRILFASTLRALTRQYLDILRLICGLDGHLLGLDLF
jgi:hypothetical protein